MSKPIILGLNKNTLNLIKDYPDARVIDDHSQLETIDFNDSVLLRLNHLASDVYRNLQEVPFDEKQAFYTMVSNELADKEYYANKELLEILKEKEIEILKGRFTKTSDTTGSLHYLNEERELEFSELIDNRNPIEKNPYQSPFVFTLRQFLECQQLFKRVLVDAKTLRGLEIADMLARFGVEVTLVTPRRLFTEVNHLIFRDGVRDALLTHGIQLLEKYEVESIEDLNESVICTIKPLSQLAFEITEPVSEKQIEVDALIIEEYDTPSSDILWTDPVLAMSSSDEKGEIYQFEAHDLFYFDSLFETEGGIELIVKDNHLIGGTFFCFNAVDFKQTLELIKDKSLDEIHQLQSSPLSVLGTFKEMIEIINRKRGLDARQETSRLN